MSQESKQFFQEIIKTIFFVSTVTFVVFLFLELFKHGLVTNYFSLNIFLIISLISGIVFVLVYPDENREKKKTNFRNYLWTALIGIVAGLFIFYQMKNIGWLSYVVSVLSVGLTILILIILKED